MATPTENDMEITESETRFDDLDKEHGGEPKSGESTERDPAWRPSDDPPGQGIYAGDERDRSDAELERSSAD